MLQGPTLSPLGEGDLHVLSSLSHLISVSRMGWQLCQPNGFQGEMGQPGGRVLLLRGGASTVGLQVQGLECQEAQLAAKPSLQNPLSDHSLLPVLFFLTQLLFLCLVEASCFSFSSLWAPLPHGLPPQTHSSSFQ